MPRTTVVSAPGKVLIAGGYLVLDPAFSGTVVSTSSRFYTVIQDHAVEEPSKIRVRSPQFLEATWTYEVSFKEDAVAVEPAATKYGSIVPFGRATVAHIMLSLRLVRARTSSFILPCISLLLSPSNPKAQNRSKQH